MTLFALVRNLKRQHAGQAAGFAAVTIAAAAFIVWWVSLPLLSSWGSGFATVKTYGGPVSRGPRPRGACARGRFARAQPLRKVSLRRCCARRPCRRHSSVRPAGVPELSGGHTFYGSIRTPTPLTAVGVHCVAGAIVLRGGTMPALRKSRPLWLWQLQVMLGCAIIAPLLLFSVYTGIRITDAQLRDVRENLVVRRRHVMATSPSSSARPKPR
jgi:hypothetical protein